MLDIKRDTMISEIIEECPQAMPAFQAIGMHCMGCALASGETLEEACYAHEVDPDLRDVLDAVVSSLPQ